MKPIFLCLIAVLITASGFGQIEGKVSLRVLNSQNQPAENATVELLRSKDSSLIKTALSDKNGVAEFERLSFNTYLLRISHANHSTFFSSAFSIDANNPIVAQKDFILQPKDAKQMEGVTVTAKKPFIQKLNERIVVNV